MARLRPECRRQSSPYAVVLPSLVKARKSACRAAVLLDTVTVWTRQLSEMP